MASTNECPQVKKEVDGDKKIQKETVEVKQEIMTSTSDEGPLVILRFPDDKIPTTEEEKANYYIIPITSKILPNEPGARVAFMASPACLKRLCHQMEPEKFKQVFSSSQGAKNVPDAYNPFLGGVNLADFNTETFKISEEFIKEWKKQQEEIELMELKRLAEAEETKKEEKTKDHPSKSSKQKKP